jgi:hypothetical protein
MAFIAGRDVIDAQLTVTVFPGAAGNRMWHHHREEHAKDP